MPSDVVWCGLICEKGDGNATRLTLDSCREAACEEVLCTKPPRRGSMSTLSPPRWHHSRQRNHHHWCHRTHRHQCQRRGWALFWQSAMGWRVGTLTLRRWRILRRWEHDYKMSIWCQYVYEERVNKLIVKSINTPGPINWKKLKLLGVDLDQTTPRRLVN